jgi:hypothetical protein
VFVKYLKLLFIAKTIFFALKHDEGTVVKVLTVVGKIEDRVLIPGDRDDTTDTGLDTLIDCSECNDMKSPHGEAPGANAVHVNVSTSAKVIEATTVIKNGLRNDVAQGEIVFFWVGCQVRFKG